MRPSSRFGSALTVAATVAAPLSAMAAPSIDVDVAGDCPSVAQVEEQLGAAMPEVAQGNVSEGAVVLSVRDLGGTYSVAILETNRTFVEPSRDCVERARVVSVVAALAMDPLNVPYEAEQETAPAPPERSDSAPGLAIWLGTEVSRVPNASLGVGPVLHVRGARGFSVLDALLGFRSGMRSEFNDASSVVYTLPFALSALMRHLGDGYTAGAGAGVAVDVISVRGRGLPLPAAGTRAAIGANVSVYLTIPLQAQLGAFANLSASYFPRPYSLEIAGRGVVGETATVWAGLSTGITYDLQ